MSGGGWKRYAGPAAFLLAATIAVVLVRAGLESGHGGSTTVSTTQSRPGGATTITTAAGKRRRRFYTVQAGDSFGAIAAKTKVPVATIERLNPGVASTTLHIGQRLRIG